MATSCEASKAAAAIELTINNVVCSFSTRCHLNLRKIATQGIHVEYKKENSVVNMRLRKPHTTATVWSSGKITCVGAKSEMDAYKAARRYCRLLQKMQFKVKLCNYRVVNVLATCAVPFALDVAQLANQYQTECSYEPELHPGATFRLKEHKTTLKLFATGSITLTAPSVQAAQASVDHMYPILERFKHVSGQQEPSSAAKPVTTAVAAASTHIPASSSADLLLNSNGAVIKSSGELFSTANSAPSLTSFSSSSSVPIAAAATATPPTTDSYFNNFHNHNHNHLYHHTNDLLTSPSSFEHDLQYYSNPSSQHHHHHHHHHLQTNFYHQHSAPSHQLFSTSSSSLPASTTSASSSQPNNWFYDNLIIEPVDDFLP